MMSLAARRSATAAGRISARRFQSTSSTTTNAANTAKETAAKAQATASEYTAKAAQGLSRVTSAAGPAIAGAAKGVTGALGRVGGPVGQLVGFIERQTPFVMYYSKVGLELAKLVAKGQSISFPSISTFQSSYQALWKQLQNPKALIQTAQQAVGSSGGAVRRLSTAQLVALGVFGLECVGFYTVGQIIGRFKVVGYHGHPAGAHH
ncbi:hypothetical protein GQ53DRAFT_830319 [Thozetella sp. PMI_491]|nr:hypothetical protein GQ53DRAFT_830319 [Thozetella sp. PMI_491]